ncbi:MULTISPECIES: hypothetical protein [unclassified Streptomyces]|uniref:hypothetical protein n=1 Tax=unclassified Streptomyces TaxID=2593676 RepID=UPI0004C1BCC0|nr:MULTISPECIES: hypothetical protein [unclassified Streptomyces]
MSGRPVRCGTDALRLRDGRRGATPRSAGRTRPAPVRGWSAGSAATCGSTTQVTVEAAVINPLDTAIASGALEWLGEYRFPLTLGLDGAGP